MAALNPLGFLLGQSLLGGSGAGSVLEMIEKQGLQVAKNYLHGKAIDLVNAKAEKVAAKMKSDGWKVGAPYPKHPGRIIRPEDMTHDAFYRSPVGLLIPRGGFLKDQARDAIDHAIGPSLLASVPTGDVDAAWIVQVGTAGVDYGFGLLPF